MGDVVVLHFGHGGEAAGLADTCEAYRVLLDDMLARLDALRGVELTWGDTVEIWIADARRLIDEINRNTPLVRVAQQVAARLGPLRLALEAMERQRPHDIGEPDGQGAAALMAEARSVNDDLKARLVQPRNLNRAAVIPVSPLPTGDETHGVRAAELAMPIIVERGSLQRLDDEACSAIYHGAEALRAASAAGAIMGAMVRARLRGLVSHLGSLPRSVAKLGAREVLVMRKDAGDFLPNGSDAE